MNAAGLKLLKSFEGFRGMPYKDPVGLLTIGYGHRLPLSEDEASVLLEYKLKPYEQVVLNAIDVPLTGNQLAALTSFTYNVGIKAFQGSTLRKKLNDGRYAAVPTELMKWTKGTINGKKQVLDGLVRRRAAEAALWNS